MEDKRKKEECCSDGVIFNEEEISSILESSDLTSDEKALLLASYWTTTSNPAAGTKMEEPKAKAKAATQLLDPLTDEEISSILGSNLTSHEKSSLLFMASIILSDEDEDEDEDEDLKCSSPPLQINKPTTSSSTIKLQLQEKNDDQHMIEVKAKEDQRQLSNDDVSKGATDESLSQELLLSWGKAKVGQDEKLSSDNQKQSSLGYNQSEEDIPSLQPNMSNILLGVKLKGKSQQMETEANGENDPIRRHDKGSSFHPQVAPLDAQPILRELKDKEFVMARIMEPHDQNNFEERLSTKSVLLAAAVDQPGRQKNNCPPKWSSNASSSKRLVVADAPMKKRSTPPPEVPTPKRHQTSPPALKVTHIEEETIPEEPSSLNLWRSRPNTCLTAGSSILSGTSHSLDRDFLRCLSTSSDQQLVDDMPFDNLKAQLTSHLSKASIMAESILARWEAEQQKLEVERQKLSIELNRLQSEMNQFSELKGQLSSLHEKYDEIATTLSKAEIKVVELSTQQDEVLERAREEGRHEGRDSFFEVFQDTEEGRAFLEACWQSRLAEFLKSNKFKQILVNKALKYYYHGINTCADQLEAKGVLRLGQLDENVDRVYGLHTLPSDSEDEGETSTAVDTSLTKPPNQDDLPSNAKTPIEEVDPTTGANPQDSQST